MKINKFLSSSYYANVSCAFVFVLFILTTVIMPLFGLYKSPGDGALGFIFLMFSFLFILLPMVLLFILGFIFPDFKFLTWLKYFLILLQILALLIFLIMDLRVGQYWGVYTP